MIAWPATAPLFLAIGIHNSAPAQISPGDQASNGNRNYN